MLNKKKLEAKLVAKGFTQREVINFPKVFSFVVRHASIRIILSLVAVNNIHIEHMDVKTAFLHEELQKRHNNGFNLNVL